jgi:hypothetical protein
MIDSEIYWALLKTIDPIMISSSSQKLRDYERKLLLPRKIRN